MTKSGAGRPGGDRRGDLQRPESSFGTFSKLVKIAWVYKWLVLVAFVASIGTNAAILSRAPLVYPLLTKIFPSDEFGGSDFLDRVSTLTPSLGGDASGDAATGDPAGDSATGDDAAAADGAPADVSGGGNPAEGAAEPAAPVVRVIDRHDSLPSKLRGMFEKNTRIARSRADRFHFLILISVIGVIAALIGAASTYIGIVVGRYVQFRCLNDVRVKVYRHLIGLSLRFYHRQKSGELLSRLTNDLLLTQRVLNFILVEMIQHPVRIVMAVVAMFVISWQMSLLVLIVMPCLIYPLLKLGKRVFKAAKKRQVQQADLTESMLQTFSGIRVIQAFRMEDAETSRFDDQNQVFLKRSMKVERAKATARALTEGIYSAGIPVMIVGGGYLILDGVVSFGQFVMLLVIVGNTYPSIKSLSKVFNQLLECLAGANRVFDLLEERTELVDRPGAKPMPPIERSIACDGLTFAYDSEAVLRDLNFEVPAGKMIAVVGPSGAGKSTLLDLIARFYDPDEGCVRFDGVDVREFQRDSLLAGIAVVTQDAFLFNTTIYENILFARPGATRDEVEAAARAAQIHDFIETLPEGYETSVGERGSLLSGGQRQRVTIARALLRNPPLLLLDEATSSLDTESENLVQEALRSLLKGRTTFVIAHRLSTVQDADCILVLEDGQLVEQGTHEDLLERKGVYSNLYNIQFKESPDAQ